MNRKALGSSLFIVTALFLLSSCSGEKRERPVMALPVEVATAVQKQVPVQLSAIGAVQPYSTVTVKSRVTGQILRVSFKEGQDVTKGALLFMIDPRPFEAALKQAEANLERDLAHVRQAEANLERDRVQEKNAKADADRYQMLFEKGVVARQQYDKVRTDWEAFVAMVEADRAAKANAEAAVLADRAAVENARLQLSYCFIHSPIDGRTGGLIVQEGNLVKENDASLVVIHQMNPILVSFSLPEQCLGDIKKYLRAGTLKIEARVPNTVGNPHHGFVSFVDNAVDTGTGTIKLKGTFTNTDRGLWPGQFVNVVLTLTTESDVIVVPSSAIQTGQEGQYVFVVKQDLTVESRPVVAGQTVNGEVVVRKGLRADEQVVTDGQLRLYPGALVEIKKSNSNKAQKPKTP